MFVDYYAALNLQPSCTAKDIREAFKRLALLCHPDRTDGDHTRDFNDIKDAYDVLSDPARRYLYDLDYADAIGSYQRHTVHRKRCNFDRSLHPRSSPQASASVSSSIDTTESALTCSQPTATPNTASSVRGEDTAGLAGRASLLTGYRQGSAFRAVRSFTSAVKQNQGFGAQCGEEKARNMRASPQATHLPAAGEAGFHAEIPPQRRSTKKARSRVPPAYVRRTQLGSECQRASDSSVRRGAGFGAKMSAVCLGEENILPQCPLRRPTREAASANILKTWKTFFGI
uniref:Uncharacterized protein TCIL3000_9_4450 n=1 Tax=Trypanosoma congolense (strain IL3000) TaxID=1068625 RepID=G0UUI1_TRYCI|nr:unnamed protein product [Trypanosoma congolense IL3000]